LTGISEILVLVLLITCILILPRMFKAPAELKISPKLIKKLSLKNRLAVVLTLVYPLAMALYLKPWNENLIAYISYAIVPVLLFYATIWILAARKK
jgi:hypothetical protein